MELKRLKERALELLEKYELPVGEEEILVDEESFMVFSPLSDTYRCTKRILELLRKEANTLGINVFWDSNPTEEDLMIYISGEEDWDLQEDVEVNKSDKEEFLKEAHPYWLKAEEIFGLDPFHYTSRGFLIVFSWKS